MREGGSGQRMAGACKPRADLWMIFMNTRLSKGALDADRGLIGKGACLMTSNAAGRQGWRQRRTAAIRERMTGPIKTASAILSKSTGIKGNTA